MEPLSMILALSVYDPLPDRKNWEIRKRGCSLKMAKFSHVNVQVLSFNMVIVSSP